MSASLPFWIFLDADLDALLAAVGELSDNPDGGQIAALAGATCRGDRLQDRDSLGRQVLDGARLDDGAGDLDPVGLGERHHDYVAGQQRNEEGLRQQLLQPCILGAHLLQALRVRHAQPVVTCCA